MTMRLAIVDLETTGANSRVDRITEVGIVVIDDDHLIEEYSTLVNPGRCIPADIETLTGISQAMVESAPAFADIALELAARLNGRVLVAHNARFDYAFLRDEFRRTGLPFRSDVLCSVRLSRRLSPEHPCHNLDSLIERYGLTCDVRHRALPDARLVRQLLDALVHRLGREAVHAAMQETIDALRAPSGVDLDLVDDIPQAPGVYWLHNAEGTALYAGKAANLRSQVLAHFSQRAANGGAQREAIRAGRLEWMMTPGPLSAALHQIQLIQRLTPLHNRAPRTGGEAWAIRWNDGRGHAVTLTELDDVPAEQFPDLCGPFRSREDANKALFGLAKEHRLCHSLLGLAPEGVRCPGHASGQCRGACAGEESAAMHHLRAIQALSRLRMPAWPFRGSIALAERDWEQTDCEVLVLNAWRHLGSARSPAELDALARARDELPPFDVDVFRLLQRALPRHRWPIVDLADAKASSRCLIRGQRNPDPPDGGVDESAFRT